MDKMDKFLTADLVASSLEFSKIYIYTRRKDEEELYRSFAFSERNGCFLHIFPNGEEVMFGKNGEVNFTSIEGREKSFPSTPQFIAWYLASHW